MPPATVTGMSTRLVVKLTCGADAPERANQALTVAATALASGVEVSLWLAGEGAWLAVPGRADALDLPYAAPATDLVAALLDGAAVTVCTQCAARRDLALGDLLPGTQIRGAAAFVEEILGGDVQALVY